MVLSESLTQLERSLRRLRANPPEAEFSDVRRVLEAHGWTQARQSGSHVSFTRPGERTIVIPLHSGSRVKRVYVAFVLELIEKGE